MRDEQELYSLLIRLHKHNQNGWGIPYDPSTVLAHIEVGTRPIHSARTNQLDHRAGWIGVIGTEGSPLIGSVGIFLAPAAWFTRDVVSLFEIWLFVEPSARGRYRLERELFAYADKKHEAMKAELCRTDYPFTPSLQTGFLHRGKRFGAMARLWRRMSRAEPVGMLFLKP